MSKRTDAIVEWLRRRLNQSGARGLVFGLSGGIDSAVVARLCQLAAPANVVYLADHLASAARSRAPIPPGSGRR